MKRALSLVLLGGLSSSCLPSDNRPEPGQLFVTAEPSDATLAGFSTEDGWTVRFDHFVTALGDIHLEDHPERGSGSCNNYADTHYEWLFDFTAVTSPQKVGLTFGLGTCGIEFRFRGPSAETVLGLGATQEALLLMLLQGSDPIIEAQRASVVAIGSGEKDGITKRFQWVFRASYELEKCPEESGEGFVSVLGLSAGDELSRTIEVRGEELFRRAPLDSSPLVFEPYAAADRDGDDNITFAELFDEATSFHSEDEWIDLETTAPEQVPSIFLAFIYRHLLPRIARMKGSGPCEAELRERNW